jgi:predicted DsbA family dithiol-disulfide isomerase
VQWVYFPLHADTPSQGLLLEDLFAGRGMDLEAMYVRMKGLMDAEGLPYGRRTHTYNTRLAQELAKWADWQPGFESIHGLLYRAYFVENRNIGDPQVLLEIVQAAGLSPEGAKEVLMDRTFKAAVDADWQRAREFRITGVPSFVAGKYKVVGAQPYDVLADLVRAAQRTPQE